MKKEETLVTDVAIVGAGPVGLTIANYLGLYGVPTIVLEGRDELIDYPRGVGMDDECLRVFQSIGLADQILPHTTPDHWMRFLTARGRCFASVEPRTREFGWPRRNAFIQPLIDQVLCEGLERFDSVEIRFGTAVEGLTQTHSDVTLQTIDGDRKRKIQAKLVVGSDGGRSFVRKALGIEFQGKTSGTRWVVVDIENDPLGTPNLSLVCDPARPYVSISLPHGIRRFEFMLMPGETEESIQEPKKLRGLLSKVVDDPDTLKLIRARVYTHSARLADHFVSGRVALAGDAAHLMPVWQGQGFNSGIRDAGNLGWKLAAIAKGDASPGLLKTYETERREHARAMISLSVTAGKIFSPTSRFGATVRDYSLLALNAIPPIKRYLLQMKFKPLPRYTDGVVAGNSSVVGRLFPQPNVASSNGENIKLDDAIGAGFAVLGWSVDPARALSEKERAAWADRGAEFVVVRPMAQLGNVENDHPDTIIIGDVTGALQTWFGTHKTAVAVLRPDRFVAGVTIRQGVARLLDQIGVKMSVTPRIEAETQTDENKSRKKKATA